MGQGNTPSEQTEELQRYVAWLEQQLERQRQMNSDLRLAAAELARTFQTSLVEVVRAADGGDIQTVREAARATQTAWRAYLAQIIAASKRPSFDVPGTQDHQSEPP